MSCDGDIVQNAVNICFATNWTTEGPMVGRLDVATEWYSCGVDYDPMLLDVERPHAHDHVRDLRAANAANQFTN